MKADVICISHRTGASGYDVGEAAAGKLGYQLADDAIIMAAAQTEGLLPEAVSMAENPKAKRTLEVDFGRFEKTEAIRELIRQAVVDTADAGNVVIVSHAASFALADRENILRVFITASDETRTRRIAEIDGVDEKQAAKRVAESDKARGEYLQAFYSVKAELPEHFDLVLSTDRLSVDEAAALIAAAAENSA
jgi:cytidylate kinase